LARRIGAALTYDARELYPHVAATAGRPWATWFWRTLESKLVRSCDALFTVSDSIADHIAAQYGIPRPTVVENIPARKVVARSNLLHSILGIRKEAPVVLHQGHIKRDRGCEILVRAASEVPDAHFVFLGDGPMRPHLQALSASLGTQSRVHFLDPVEPSRLLDYSAAAAIGVTLLEDTCLNHHFALPNKLFEYLMAGTPVLASDLPEIRRVVIGFQVGRLARPGSVSDTATQLRLMLAAPTELETYAKNTRNVLETISWEKASDRFLDVFSGLLDSRT
jgi:glycosyltransferase involved in cell wall biosynthesis